MLTVTKQLLPLSNQAIRETFAEFLGTFILVFLGNSSLAEAVLSKGKAGSTATIYIGYALGAFIGVLIAGGVSGAHLNPAVTVAGAVVKRFEWRKVPHYLLAQYLGGFMAACCTYLLYLDAFNSFHRSNGISLTSAGIFATFPRDGLSVFGAFVDQIFGTAVLLIAIYAITDQKNAAVPAHLVPLYVSAVIESIGCSIGYNEGFAINPARDLAPRFFTYLSCWGDQVFQSKSYWYVPIVGPHVGGILGAYLYIFFIERLRDKCVDDKSKSQLTVQNEKKMSMGSLRIPVPHELYKKSPSISSQGEYNLRL